MDNLPKLTKKIYIGPIGGGEWEDGIREGAVSNFYDGFQKILRKLGIDLKNKNTTVLEVGSGNAVFLNYMIKKGVNAVGVDIRPRGGSDSHVLARIEKLPFRDESFDAIFSHGTFDDLNYIQYQDLMMKEIARVLKSGGVYVGAGMLSGPRTEELRLITDRYRDFWKVYQKP